MKLFRYVALSLMALTMFSPLKAVQAYSTWKTFRQSDSTTIRVRLCGDEFFQYYLTEDNVPLLRAANGDFCYLQAAGFKARSSGVVAHEAAMRTPQEKKYITSLETLAQVNRRNPQRLRTASLQRQIRTARSRQRVAGAVEEKRALVLMIEFSDQSFRKNAVKYCEAMLNEEGYTGGTLSPEPIPGSVKDYFRQQSDGQFNVTFDVVGPVRASGSCYYYGIDSEEISEMYVGRLLSEVLKKVDADVDFSRYDWYGNGEVDLVFFVYAGYGAHVVGNDPNLIWPHAGALSLFDGYESGITLDGVLINQYACSSEMLYNNLRSGIGVFCHEFSHCLGLYDFYTNTDAPDPRGYDLMANGSHNLQTWAPCNYTALEKYMLGWKDFTPIEQSVKQLTLTPVSQGGEGYLLCNAVDKDGDLEEFYVLENRQQEGWDAHIPGHGLTVSHYDYDRDLWFYSKANDDPEHPRAYIIPAGNNYGSPASYPFPYEGNDSLTNSSIPAARVFRESSLGNFFMNKPITNIRETDGIITLDVTIPVTGVKNAVTDGSGQRGEEQLRGKAVSVYNAQGQLVDRIAQFSSSEHLPVGIYLLMDEKTRETIKIIRR